MGVSEGIIGAAFDALPSQIAILEDSGEIVYTNRAWREFGAENGLVRDSVGQNYLTVCEESDDELADRIADGLRSLLAGERATVAIEYPCHGPGEKRWFTMRADGFRHDGAQYALVMHLDITERKLAERQVREHNERLETMTAVLAHDLRNPLNVAFACASMLDSDADELLESLKRMDTIIEDVLVLARDGSVEATESVELGERAEAAWEHVETPDARLSVVDSATFEADSDLLDHVFENLFRNAVEHGSTSPRSQTREDAVEHGSTSSRTQFDDAVEHGSTGDRETSGEEHGIVTVTVGTLGEASNGDVEGFYVEDDGPGIPAEERDAILERGYTTESSNTGLGLAMVTHVAEAHDWDVAVTEGTTGGARFELRF